MTVYLAWTGAPLPGHLPGPWEEVRVLTDDLALVASEDTLSRVYHELKWSLPDGTALLVSPVDRLPKLKGMPAGTQSWLHARVPPR
ncbi:hypothetical protein JQN72_07990 [Phycicoccus sp. CSK15P-2]|uniref:hypothetical protein n=1 Tax=Phycicoccus sp. CSK15P-2 TaxID=2807627 RepID=UPI00194E6FBE|nr:hypothetical protein [Phycicoccus sp. CSK15P-2]MBM6404183.1 hypothetical protein [Phycicoccus sp. CSK15P-2]